MEVLRKAFKQALHPHINKFVSSVKDDHALIKSDIRGSKAHALMLAASGLIGSDEADQICAGLEQLEEEFAQGKRELNESYEDVHMNVEKYLEELIGEPALRLHTARSRNDQVALDLRLYILDKIDDLDSAIEQAQLALLTLANRYVDVVMPGYTHLQRAQPVLFAHVMHAFVEQLMRDRSRFQEAAVHTAVSPLGAGAQAGTSLAIQPQLSAQKLGLKKCFENSVDAVSDRDFVADFLYASSLTAIHLSQIAETFIIWSTREFNFIAFNDSVTTTSSLMPQKKNPDPLELIRAKSGIAVGELTNLLIVLKGLPIGYNRDLQETKPPVTRVAESLLSSLESLSIIVEAVQVNAEAMLQAASDPEIMTTDLVEYLVNKKVPFRKAHDAVSELIVFAREEKIALPQIKLSNYQKFAPEFTDDLFELFDPQHAVKSKESSGGTGPNVVHKALQSAHLRVTNCDT